jgi:hypothetical protein
VSVRPVQYIGSLEGFAAAHWVGRHDSALRSHTSLGAWQYPKTCSIVNETWMVQWISTSDAEFFKVHRMDRKISFHSSDCLY